MRKLFYLLIILSYFTVAFILLYSNLDASYNKTLALSLTIFVIIVWLSALYLFAGKKVLPFDKTEKILFQIVISPFTIPLILLVCVFLAVCFPFSYHKHRFQSKTKWLEELGYSLTKTRVLKQRVFLLTKNNVVIRVIPKKEHQISFDNGRTFTDIIDSVIFTEEEKQKISYVKMHYMNIDYRDRVDYDIDQLVLDIIAKHFESIDNASKIDS